MIYYLENLLLSSKRYNGIVMKYKILSQNNNITLLGSSKTTKYQIFKYKNHAYGIQFHIEIKDNTVSQWACVPEYEMALEDTLGKGALQKFDQLAKDNMSLMNFNAENLYNNFKKIL